MPEKINTIVDAVVEIRFISSFPPDAVFGLIYKGLKSRYSEPQPLPILQMPENIRELDGNLKYQPYHQFENEQFLLSVGPRVIVLRDAVMSRNKKYADWSAFMEELGHIIEELSSSEVVGKIERFGVRYINFFKDNIFSNTQISINTSAFVMENTFLGCEVASEDNGLRSRIQISNSAEVQASEGPRKGSVVDIDTFREKDLDLGTLLSLIDEGHTVLKDLFLNKVITEELKNKIV